MLLVSVPAQPVDLRQNYKSFFKIFIASKLWSLKVIYLWNYTATGGMS